eukprot:m.17745 g.17745  ORF g.17745 m.17745 type:complete len:704 (-) comp6098_c0_seq1:1644-3755(-)
MWNFLILYACGLASIGYAASVQKREDPAEPILVLDPLADDAMEMRDMNASIKRDAIKEMMEHAWRGYDTYAYGMEILRPCTKEGDTHQFPSDLKGMSIVDSLDTLILMGMDDDVKKARNWIDANLKFTTTKTVSMFETNIRYLGGLLSAYAMTGDAMYKSKAYDLGQRMLPAFNTPTGIPHNTLNLGKKVASGDRANLAELGTLQLEFEYLSTITGDMRFADVTRKLTNYIVSKRTSKGIYYNHIDIKTGEWESTEFSLSGGGDSFYEYLLKVWIYHGSREQEREAFDDAMRTVFEILIKDSPEGHTYVSTMNGYPQKRMGHLACFAGGMMRLAMDGAPDDMKLKYENYSVLLTETCHAAYRKTSSKLGPEEMWFTGGDDASALFRGPSYYILRPETVESYFYMWRFTKDVKWRKYAWQAAKALNTSCRCDAGFAGLQNVNRVSSKNDAQETFFLAETLKYLYLTFSEDELIPLDKWVFNTEAHPFPIQPPNVLHPSPLPTTTYPYSQTVYTSPHTNPPTTIQDTTPMETSTTTSTGIDTTPSEASQSVTLTAQGNTEDFTTTNNEALTTESTETILSTQQTQQGHTATTPQTQLSTSNLLSEPDVSTKGTILSSSAKQFSSHSTTVHAVADKSKNSQSLSGLVIAVIVILALIGGVLGVVAYSRRRRRYTLAWTGDGAFTENAVYSAYGAGTDDDTIGFINS